VGLKRTRRRRARGSCPDHATTVTPGTWVRDIENDTARQALVAGINHFATLTNCRVSAEGIETDVECEALRRLGIDFGQGFLFGHPEPVDAYAP
jgi:EAL domain-containing protein (putative c-di-GMP-specific phosphodiesterase class I)